MSRIISTVLTAGLAIGVLANLPQVPEAAPLPQQGGMPGCRYKITMSACTSCSQTGVQDIECKSGMAFEGCNTGFMKCQNGAQCDQHSGVGPC